MRLNDRPSYLDPHPFDPGAVFVPMGLMNKKLPEYEEYFEGDFCRLCPSNPMNQTSDCHRTNCAGGVFIPKALMPELILQGIITP